MKASRQNIKFSVTLLVVCLFSTIPVYSGDQTNITQNVSRWDKCKASINNSAKFLKKNADYIAAAVIPTLVILKLSSGITPELRRKQARDFINFYKNRNFIFRMLRSVNIQKNDAIKVIGLSDEGLKKFIKKEKWLGSLAAGLFGFTFYLLYKNWNSPDFRYALLPPEKRIELEVKQMVAYFKSLPPEKIEELISKGILKRIEPKEINENIS